MSSQFIIIQYLLTSSLANSQAQDNNIIPIGTNTPANQCLVKDFTFSKEIQKELFIKKEGVYKKIKASKSQIESLYKCVSQDQDYEKTKVSSFYDKCIKNKDVINPQSYNEAIADMDDKFHSEQWGYIPLPEEYNYFQYQETRQIFKKDKGSKVNIWKMAKGSEVKTGIESPQYEVEFLFKGKQIRFIMNLLNFLPLQKGGYKLKISNDHNKQPLWLFENPHKPESTTLDNLENVERLLFDGRVKYSFPKNGTAATIYIRSRSFGLLSTQKASGRTPSRFTCMFYNSGNGKNATYIGKSFNLFESAPEQIFYYQPVLNDAELLEQGYIENLTANEISIIFPHLPIEGLKSLIKDQLAELIKNKDYALKLKGNCEHLNAQQLSYLKSINSTFFESCKSRVCVGIPSTNHKIPDSNEEITTKKTTTENVFIQISQYLVSFFLLF